MAAKNTCTIVHNGPNNQTLHLPLQEVSIDALIVDVSAQVKLSHVFTNPDNIATGRAKYVFPVPARAAVSGFEMQTSDGRLVVGVAKDNVQAEEEYKAAVDEGKFSGLMQWSADDIFTISVGSIPARATVTTTLTCVMDLMDNDFPDEVRFQLPMAIGAMRYGTPPPNTLDATSAGTRTRLRIAARIQTAGEMKSVTSPSHGSTLIIKPYRTHHHTDSRRRTTAYIESPEFLTGDFVLVIRAEGLDMPRCFAERDAKGRGTVALQLSVVPKFPIPPLPAQEYLFLVDRSGSMTGQCIETARSTLGLLLRFIPADGSMVNIFSFGSHCDSLWPSSRAYDQSALTVATQHLDTMWADYGGTETLLALRQVFSRRRGDMRTVLFVLTDGEDHNIDATIATVQQAVTSSPPSASLRVFTLGIGPNVSTAMCEGIARAGDGVCLLALNTAEIAAKCFQLVRAGRSSLVNDVTVDWGAKAGKQNAQLFRQSPTRIGTVYPSLRFVAFAITDAKHVPKEVTLSGVLNEGGTQVTLTVPVRLARFKPLDEGMIHSLAARHLIRDLEEGGAPHLQGEALRTEIVKLGVEYQVASRYTSFVGVDVGNTIRQRAEQREREREERENRRNRGRASRNVDAQQESEDSWDDYMQKAFDAITGVFSWVLGYSSGPRGRTIPGGWTSRRESRSRSSTRSRSVSSHDPQDDDAGNFDDQTGGEEDIRDDDGYESRESFSTLSSLESFSSWEAPRSRRRHRSPRRRQPPAVERRSPSPRVQQMPNSPVQERSPVTPTSANASTRIAPDVIELVHLQQFDGSFALRRELGDIVGQRAIDEAKNLPAGVDQTLWATAVAVAFFTKNLGPEGQGELLEGLREKIGEYLQSRGIGKDEFDQLVDRAKGIID
ncbi:hypothetical protein DENSPDRAFT_832185 [Dentipellis sp. KUC8613]|nr:hypothetical protein DENSPDRAFT_832185 [Dentipellis sp. KUC8613]